MAKRSILSRPSGQVDSTLAALFASSSGPVQASNKPRYLATVLREKTEMPTDPVADSNVSQVSVPDEEGGNDELNESSSSSEEDDQEKAPENGNVSLKSLSPKTDTTVMSPGEASRKRKRKQVDALDDIERKHLEKMAEDEDVAAKRSKTDDGGALDESAAIPGLFHESLARTTSTDAAEVEQASRTVFLSNVSVEAVTSKRAKRQLLAHLSSVLLKDSSPPQAVVSLRFRSVPVSTAAMPKRAAIITQAVMEATTKSTNAYAVYSDAAAARAATSKLNGTVVLDRHLRVDSVAHPAPIDHKRCVFVGNLGFVDDETVISLTVDEDGKEKTEKRKRTKVPMDVEEGLWRTFGQEAGKVENVRVVRDPTTRVGKGFAYVQFYDANSVESALLLEGKKFPPLLPRALRVTRCKAPHKTLRAVERSAKAKTAAMAGAKSRTSTYVRKVTAEARTSVGRAGRLLGRAAAARADRPQKSHVSARTDRTAKPGFKLPEDMVFEGQRASANDGKPRDLKFGRAKKAQSNNKKRQARRTANWRKQGRGGTD